MAEDKQNNSASEILSKGANAAQTVRGAIKTGKAITGAAKGAAVGGPYGAAAMAVWQNRKLVVKIIAASAFIMILPILFIMMLPSLIFGGLNRDSTGIPVMNDNQAIYANIEDVNSRIHEILQREHTAKLDEIQALIDALPTEDEHEIIDSFNVDAGLDVNILISQYCAYKENYEEIVADDLISIIEEHKAELFSFTEDVEEKEIVRQKEVEVIRIIKEYKDITVTDARGNTYVERIEVEREVIEIEIIEETVTIIKHTYIISFVGETYFANEVFNLDEEQAALANDYAYNLTTFLEDRDDEGVNGNDSHKGIGNLVKDDSNPYSGGAFASPVSNWRGRVTSEFGNRTDPITKNTKFHSGIDIGVPTGTPIYAAEDGTVLYAKKLSTGYGYHIVINHGGKLTTLYGHCSELLASGGQTVKRGDMIAKVGSTGRSTGPHLHFEVIADGKPQNPRDYLE